MREVDPRPNVELRVAASGEPVVVFGFPYSAERVAAMRAIPGRRFDWDAREWSGPQHEAPAVYVADVLAPCPDLAASDTVRAWLDDCDLRWLGRVTTRKHAGAGQFVVHTAAGTLPDELRSLAVEGDERSVELPFSEAVAETLAADRGARGDGRAAGCVPRRRGGLEPPGAALVVEHTVAEPRFGLDVLWDTDAAIAFVALPGADVRTRTLLIVPWVLEPLQGFLREHTVALAATAQPFLAQVRSEHAA